MQSKCGTRAVSWDEIEPKLERVLGPEICSELGAVVGKLKSAPFFVATYTYGDLIVDRGEFKCPCVGDVCATCRQLQQSLYQEDTFTRIPLVCILDGCVEVFIEYPQDEGPPRLAPLRLLRKDELFGVFETLDSILHTTSARPAWSVSSGARSVWVIAPIGDGRLPKEIGKICGKTITWNADRHPQWQLVKSVARYGSEWSSEVVLFPRVIVEAIKSMPTFFNKLLEVGWQQSSRLRHTATEDANLREAIHRALKAYNLPQGELFQYVTIKHFFDIAEGHATAFRASSVDIEEAGPFGYFQQCLQAALSSMHPGYRPVIMQPTQLNKAGEAAYYSLRCPSVPGPRPHKFKESLAQMASSYLDVIREMGGQHSEILCDERLSFYVRVVTDGNSLPSGVWDSSKLPVSDFCSERKAADTQSMYLASPFLLAVARIVRAGPVSTQMRSNQRHATSNSRRVAV